MKEGLIDRKTVLEIRGVIYEPLWMDETDWQIREALGILAESEYHIRLAEYANK